MKHEYNETEATGHFQIDYHSERVLFRIDNRQREIIGGRIEIQGTVVTILLNAVDAHMIIRQTPGGWHVTEELFPDSIGRIVIGGSIHSPNVNIGGTQIISGGVHIKTTKNE